jgi:hypothetical protein
MEEFRRLTKAARRRRVPVENTGGPGTRNSHWRERVFRNELMSSAIAGARNPLSRLTVASLGDLGYQVDLDAAEPFALPSLIALPEAGPRPVREAGVVLPVVPEVVEPGGP